MFYGAYRSDAAHLRNLEMEQRIISVEDDFTLEFITASDISETNQNKYMQKAIGLDGYVLQEKIILPPKLTGKADAFSLHSVLPARCNAPTILVGHPNLPAQYSAFIARFKQGRSFMEKQKESIKLTANDLNILFSAPLYSREEKTVESFAAAFEKISETLHSCAMREEHIARTWLYLDDILNDYEILNKARESFFARWYSPLNHFIPASTGIEGKVINKEPLSVEFCAFAGKRLSIKQQASPLQNEATSYGKLFSRCVSVTLPLHRLIYISGTASINITGKSIYVGDFNKQMKFTLDVLHAILQEAGGDLSPRCASYRIPEESSAF